MGVKGLEGGGRKPIDFDGSDTLFYRRVDGVLRQELRIRIINRTGEHRSGSLKVSAENFETVITSLPVIRGGSGSYAAFAPVVFPNFGDPEYHAKRHSPVSARVELRAGPLTVAKNITIGRWRSWTAYVCQDVCADFTWGYDEEETIRLSTALTSAHLAKIGETVDESFESQNRWNINQSMEVMWFLDRKRDEAHTLLEREKDGHVSISPIFNSCLTGTMNTEQAIRSMYYARELWEEHGIDLSVVEHIEVPTIAWGMATIFAGAGIKYFVKAWYDFMAPFCIGRDDIPIFRWEGPDGSQVLVASDKGACLRANYAQAGFLHGPYGEAVRELHEWWIPHFEGRADYPYDAFILLGSHGDLGRGSAAEIHRLVSNIARYNAEGWEYPKIVNANWRHFFKRVEDFAKEHGFKPPVLRGDFGSSWEEWPVHLAAPFSGVRRGVRAFLTAEKVLALASLLDAQAYVANREGMKLAQLRMEQIAEHPWNGITHAEKVRALRRRSEWQGELNAIADEVTDRALGILCGCVRTKAGIRLLVFNPSSWARTDVVRVEEGSDALPHGIVGRGGRYAISLVAKKIPPFGYKTYKITGRTLRSETGGTRVAIRDNVMENRFYRVEIDKRTGGLSSVFYKRRKVELVDAGSRYRLNQYVYLSDGVEHSPNEARITSVHRGRVSGNLTVDASTLRSNVRTTITLYADLDRIDITNEVEKAPSSEPQQVHFVFPFNVPDRAYHYEATAAIVRPGLAQYGGDQLRGSGQATHACQTFVDISNEEYGVTLAQVNSCLIQFGHRTTFEEPESPDASNSTIWSLVMLNKSPEMLADQGGISKFTFRYSIKGHDGGFRPAEAVRFGWERNDALLTKVLRPNQRGELPSKVHGFLACRDSNVVVTALKVAEGGS